MKSKVVQGLIVGMCAISLIMNVVTMSQLKDGATVGDQTTAQGQYVVDIGSIYGDPEGEQVLQQEILEKMEENGVTFTSEDTQALIDYITEQVGAQTLTYVESVLQEEVAAQTAVLLEEKYAEYNLAELTDTQIMQINEEIVRELGNHIDAFQQSYVLTPEDVDMILDAVDLDYQMSSYLYQNGYLTGESLDNFVTSWDYRVSFQKYFNGACSNAHLMSYNDTTTIVNSVRDSLYDNIKELRGNINSIELVLTDVNSQLSDIYDSIGMGDTTGNNSVNDRIATIQSNIANLQSGVATLEDTKVTVSNYRQYVADTQDTITEINSNLIALAEETGLNYDELSAAIGSNLTAITSNDEDIANNTASINQNAEDITENAEAINQNAGAISTNAVAIAQNIVDIQANLNAINTNVSSINTINSNLSALEVDVDLLASALTDSNIRIAANESAISTAQSDINTAQTAINQQGQDISSLQGNMSTAEQNISALQGNMSSTEEIIAQIQRVIESNSQSITTLESDVSTNSQDISTLQTDVSANSQNITDLQTGVATNSSDITTLQNGVASNGQNISNLQTSVTTNSGNITTLQGKVNTNTTSISGLNTSVSGLNTTVSGLQTTVGSLNTTVGGLNTTVGSHTTSLTNLQNQMRIGNTYFYFDYQNGKYGYNTSPNRGADTFHPFSSIELICQTRTFEWTSYDAPNAWWHRATGSVTFNFPNKFLGVQYISGTAGTWGCTSNASNQTTSCIGWGMAANPDGTGNVSGTCTVVAWGY